MLEHAEVVAAVVEDQEQVDKLLSIAGRLPRLKTIVYDEKRGLRGYDPTHLHAFDAVQAAGRKRLAERPEAEAGWLASVAHGDGERSRHPALHIRHDRSAEGRHALLREPRRLGAERQRLR